MMMTLLVLARLLHIGSALALAGILFFELAIARARPGSELAQRLDRWLIGALVVQFFSGALWFWIVAAQMGDGGWAPDFGLWGTVLMQTRFGQLWIARLIVAIALGLVLRIGWRLMELILSAALLVSLAWAGHAGAGSGGEGAHLAVDAIHLAGAAVWPVGLLPLLLFLRGVGKSNARETIAVVRRFSQNSLLAVLLLFLSGLGNALYMIPRWSDLVNSPYGELLTGKILLFLALVGLGAWNRLRLLPQIEATAPEAALAQLRRMIVCENVLTILVLLIVALMGAIAPPQA
jgi:putative copper resistance protein D